MTPAEAILAIMGSTVTLGPATNPEADAQAMFYNHESNSPADERNYPLTWDGLGFDVRFNFNVDVLGRDQVIITPPAGWTCEPVDCTATLQEGAQAVIDLFEWKGV